VFINNINKNLFKINNINKKDGCDVQNFATFAKKIIKRSYNKIFMKLIKIIKQSKQYNKEKKNETTNSQTQ